MDVKPPKTYANVVKGNKPKVVPDLIKNVRVRVSSRKSSVVPARSPEGKRALISRLLMSAPAVSGKCTRPVNILQTYSTCWLNAICNALFNSDAGRRLMRALYVDWVLGVRTPNDERRLNLLQYFRHMFDATEAGHGDVKQVQTEKLLLKLHRYSPKTFMDKPRNAGMDQIGSVKYLVCLLRFLGVPNKQVVCMKGQDNSWGTILDRLLEDDDAPLILIVSETGGPTPAALRDSSGKLRYVLDAKVMTSILKPGMTSCHDVAGITCGGTQRLLDSNPGDRSFVKYDWRSSKQEVRTSPSSRMQFRGQSFWNKSIYYNADKLSSLCKATKAIAQSYLDGKYLPRAAKRALRKAVLPPKKFDFAPRCTLAKD